MIKCVLDRAMPYSRAGQRIRKIRIAHKLSQEDLGGMVGTDYSLIGKIERGERRIHLELLEKIARALNVGVEELIK